MSEDQTQIKRDKKGRFTKDSRFAYWQGKDFTEEHRKNLSKGIAKGQRGVKKEQTEEEHKKSCEQIAYARSCRKFSNTNAPEERKQRIRQSNIEHNEECAKLKVELEKQGFKAIDIGALKPDVIAIKDGKIYAYEVEFQNPKYEKYNECFFFNDIIWILKSRKKNYTVVRNNNGQTKLS